MTDMCRFCLMDLATEVHCNARQADCQCTRKAGHKGAHVECREGQHAYWCWSDEPQQPPAAVSGDHPTIRQRYKMALLRAGSETGAGSHEYARWVCSVADWLVGDDKKHESKQ